MGSLIHFQYFCPLFFMLVKRSLLFAMEGIINEIRLKTLRKDKKPNQDKIYADKNFNIQPHTSNKFF